jgi:uncharacterized membrane protein YdbT with pleckstrin-like domain
MQKKNIYTLVLLIALTISTAFFSKSDIILKTVGLIILVLSAIKFVLVSFQFMEMKKAHNFWKGLIIVYLLLFVSIIYAIL